MKTLAVVALFSLAACAKPQVLTLENTLQPGPNTVQGSVTFPQELQAGARVQVSWSTKYGSSVPDLDGANGMKALDLTANAKKLDFVIKGLADGDVTIAARVYGSETMAKMKAEILEAQANFKKTGKSTMAPNPSYDFGGFYTGTPTASVEGKDAKVLSLKGAPLTGIDFTLAAIDNSEPPPFSGTLTSKLLLKMKNKAKPYDDFDKAYALFEKALGKPTAATEKQFGWAVVEGDSCTYVFFEKDERSRFFKDQTGFMVGASMPPTVAAREDAACVKLLAH
ncbi:MAG: hypothetical protein JNM69_03820 [Archangium sp.]|nr:hypothetical protein [Archangium sp.]